MRWAISDDGLYYTFRLDNRRADADRIVSRLLRQSVLTSRTIAIEVGMQNGGMAAVLAKKHFAAQPLAAVPAVFSSVIQTLVGSLLAAYWSRRPATEPAAPR